ncbi:hypothetical protein SO694_00042139 [Aureococcus anophagefferens]|uniref:NET domain-containing protein n=1 Tax=Aureococcus anophagefferens TaxID=44056 RepID=A0ABR1G7E9_AURAN
MGAAASTKEDHHIAATVDVLRAQQMAHRSTYAAKVGLFQGQKAAKPLEQGDVMDLPLPELRERLRRVFADEPDQLEVLLQLLETAGEDAGAGDRASLSSPPAAARAPAGACKRARALERLAARVGPAARASSSRRPSRSARGGRPGPPLDAATRASPSSARRRRPPDAAAMTWLPPCGGRAPS